MDTRSCSRAPVTLQLVRSVVLVMSRLAGLPLLLLLVCSRSPSNADLIHALAKHPVIPEKTDSTILRVAGAVKPENKFTHVEGGAEQDDRRSKDMADDDDDDAAVERQLTDNEHHGRDSSKRKWGKHRLQAWEKRRWSASNSRAAWGKRDGEENWGQSDLASAWDELHQGESPGKRRWSANNGMAVWGKRSRPHDNGRPKRSVGASNDEVALSPYFVDDDEQRQLVPVKRQWRTTGGRYGGPKRKWEYNTMKTWGKRPAVWPHHLDDQIDGRIWPKRRWSSDNALRVWG